MTIRYIAPLALVLACQPADSPAKGSGASRPAERATPATVTAADFETFRWIEGTWRGTGGGVDPFHERYRFVDDSTLLRLSFSDSTLGSVSDSTRIGLRDGKVLDPVDDPEWHVTAFDSTSWRFESVEHAGRAFTWRRSTPDSWTATLESRDAAGNPQQRVYTLERLPD